MAETNHGKELKGKDKFLAGLSNFLEKHRFFLWGILIAAAVIIAAVAVIDSVTESKANEAAVQLEDVQKQYDSWLEAEEADKDALEAEIITETERIAAEYESTYAAQRALYMRGNLSFQKEEWADAASFFSSSAAENSESYLAPIALSLAASSYENDGKYSEALDVYRSVYESYDKIFPDIPRVMLSIGRLLEQTGDSEAAADAYNDLLDNYPGSGWASFARTRLIYLEG